MEMKKKMKKEKKKLTMVMTMIVMYPSVLGSTESIKF